MATEGKKLRRKQFLFNGEWIPAEDPLKIGENNYAVLKNMRYRDNGLEAVNGYSKINTTALSLYTNGRNGIHFINPINNDSHILIHCQNSSGAFRTIYENKATVPDQGDFEATPLHTDLNWNGLGRFAIWPKGTVAYCNGRESKVYSGEEIRLSGLINYDPDDSFRYNYSDVIKNIENDAANIAALHRIYQVLDSTTVLLLHLENNVTDSSLTTPHTVTNANMTFNSAYKKFGAYSGYFNGTNAKLTIPDDSDFDFSGGNWAIDMWIRVTDFKYSYMPLFSQKTDVDRLEFSAGENEPNIGETITGNTSGATSVLLYIKINSGAWATNDAAGYFYTKNQTGTYQAAETLQANAIGIATASGDSSSNLTNMINLSVLRDDEKLRLEISCYYDDYTDVLTLESPNSSISLNTWYYIEIGEDADDYYLFIDGVLQDTQNSTIRAKDYRSEVSIGYWHTPLNNIPVLLLHLENNVTDSSLTTPHTVTNANMTFNSAYKKFGAYSGYFNGTNAKLTIPDDSDFDFSGGNWAIDMWIRPTGTPGNYETIFSQCTKITRLRFSSGENEPNIGDTITGDTSSATSVLVYIKNYYGGWTTNDAAGIFYTKSLSGTYLNGETLKVGATTIAELIWDDPESNTNETRITLDRLYDNKVMFEAIHHYYSSDTFISLASANNTIQKDTWYHIEVGEDGDNYYLFIDGVLQDTQNTSDRLDNHLSEIVIGRGYQTGWWFQGYIDEFRVSSATRHTAGFDAPMYPMGSDLYLEGYIDEFRVSSATRHTANFDKPTAAYVISGYFTYAYMASTRPVKAFKLYVQTANTATAILNVQYWDGSDWQDVTSLVDGTASGGVTLAQTGIVSFDGTDDIARPRMIDSMELYWYRVVATDIDDLTSLYYATAHAPFQDIRDLWDGMYRICINFQLYKNDGYNDYTLNVAAPDYSSTNEATFVQAGGLDTDDYIVAGFDERLTAFKVQLTGDSVNANVALLTVSYWNGSAWVAISNIEDGTATAGVSFAKSGIISWDPPNSDLEHKTNIGKTMAIYHYKLSFSATLSADVKIDRVYGITAPRNIPRSYTFPFMFQDRAMLCGYESGNEGNRVDYGMAGATEVFNGTDTSDGAGAIFFGGNEPLTAAQSFYSRSESSIYNFAVFTKNNETYLLYGYGPDTWKTYQISQKIGCPAPLTMDSTEISLGAAGNTPRNVAIWLSYTGPVIFDGATIIPVKGKIACYFDKNNDLCINYDAIENARGWVDPEFNEYNLLIPSGTGQTECNVWLVMDLLRRKWYEKSSTAFPQAGVRVMDTTGNQYMYGFIDTGYMLRLEHGPTWDGDAIESEIKTADQIPSGDIWDYTKIARLKLIAETMAEDINIAVKYNADGMVVNPSLRSFDLMSQDMAGVNRHTRQVKNLDLKAWSHQFRFTMSQSIIDQRIRLLMWGYQYEIIREDATVTTDGLNKLAEKMILAGR